MSPRRVFASVAEFSIYRQEQVRAEEDRAEANKRKWAEGLGRAPEVKRRKGPAAVKAGHMGPMHRNSYDPQAARKQIWTNKDQRIKGIHVDKENDERSDTSKHETQADRAPILEIQNKEIEPPIQAISDAALPTDRTFPVILSHKARLEQQFSSIMPKSSSWGSARMASNSELCELVPGIRKRRQIMIAEDDSGLPEKEVALFAQIRTADMKVKRKREAEVIPPVQKRSALPPRTRNRLPKEDVLVCSQTAIQSHPPESAHKPALVATTSEVPPRLEGPAKSDRLNAMPEANQDAAPSRGVLSIASTIPITSLPEFQTQTRVGSQSRAHLKGMLSKWHYHSQVTAASKRQ
ncbi:hypothetical protein MMC11_001816 [Xylographa trunciseda]|nr:hypothetical protein [Xylographa trunciseda]